MKLQEEIPMTAERAKEVVFLEASAFGGWQDEYAGGIPEQAAMRRSFRRIYTALIPLADLKVCAIQWYVEAIDGLQRKAHWPKGYPSVVWSATLVSDSCRVMEQETEPTLPDRSGSAV